MGEGVELFYVCYSLIGIEEIASGTGSIETRVLVQKNDQYTLIGKMCYNSKKHPGDL